MSAACQRCHAYPATRLIGLLQLCHTCVLRPTCAPFAHDYAGTMRTGQWICIACGNVLTSQPISTEPVAAPQTPDTDCGC